MAQDVYPNFSLTEFTYLVWSIMLHAVRLTFQNAILTLCSIVSKKIVRFKPNVPGSKIIHSLHVWQMTCSTYEHKTCKH